MITLLTLISSVAFSADWSVSGITGTPDEVAAFDSLGDPVTFDFDSAVEGVCDPLLESLEDELKTYCDENHDDLLDLAQIEAELYCDTLVDGLQIQALRVTPLLTTAAGMPSVIEFMESSTSSSGSSSYLAGRTTATYHFQEGPTRDYSEISVTVSSANAGYSVSMGLYSVDPSTGLCDDLIWAGVSIPTTSNGVKTWDLTSSGAGTWQAAAGTYKGTGDVLHLEPGDQVCKAIVLTGSGGGSTSFRTLTDPRAILGRPRDAGQKAYTGFRTVGTSSFPAVFVVGTGSSDFELFNSSIPVIGLR